MSTQTRIEWTDRTWNPVRGCAKVSEGCRNCYAMRMAHRFSGPGKPYAGLTKATSHGPVWTGGVMLVPGVVEEPLGWRTPQRIFVNSMSDLFHDDVPDEFIARVWWVMGRCVGLAGPGRGHSFQILTKRPARMRAWLAGWCDPAVRARWLDSLGDPAARAAVDWPDVLPDVHLGVSVEDQAAADERIPLLLDTPAAVRWLSCEPLLGALAFDHRHGIAPLQMLSAAPVIDWVVVGGESGPGARETDVDHLRGVVAQCREARVPVFVKQLGARPVDAGARARLKDRKGGDIGEWPQDLRVRQYPQ